jgi:NAD+ kinase
MPSRFRHAALVGKYQARGIGPVVEEIAQFLARQGLEVSLERETALATGLTDYAALDPDALGKACDLAVVVGGDGTMLGFARQIAPHGIPLVGINQGRLGFITDVPIKSWREAITPMLAGDYETEHRSMLEGDVWRDGESIFHGLAMNDVVVSRGTTTSMVEVRIDIGEEFVANLRADGVILSSPTGSTAYALSADRAERRAAGECRDRRRARCERQLRHAQPGQPAAVRPHRRAPLGAPGALPASARLELLRDAAPQAALAGRRHRLMDAVDA